MPSTPCVVVKVKLQLVKKRKKQAAVSTKIMPFNGVKVLEKHSPYWCLTYMVVADKQMWAQVHMSMKP